MILLYVRACKVQKKKLDTLNHANITWKDKIAKKQLFNYWNEKKTLHYKNEELSPQCYGQGEHCSNTQLFLDF